MSEKIEFSTSGEWTARDLVAAFRALDSTYTALALAQHLGRIRENEKEKLLLQLDPTSLEPSDSMGPMIRQVLEVWKDPEARAAIISHFHPSEASLYEAQKDIEFYLTHTDEFIPREYALTIINIQMASPGGFSLKGLGDPLKELRELIKDLWYRNRQERERGNLEILKERLEIASKYNLPPQYVKILAVTLSENQQDLKLLIETGQLTLAGEESARLESQPKPVKRRRSK
jgi:hypothetical protein